LARVRPKEERAAKAGKLFRGQKRGVLWGLEERKGAPASKEE
jgi:hypothetical protein